MIRWGEVIAEVEGVAWSCHRVSTGVPVAQLL